MQAVDSPGSTPSNAFIQSLIDWSLTYASGGFPVFPLHSPKKKGLCDCPAGDKCTSPAKHPRTLKGFQDAQTDEAAILRWWKMWPRANVAISIPTGYVVLDVDGVEGLEALEDRGYHIPKTPTAITGKGWHYWFRTLNNLPPRANMLPKVDLRGPGSYVVAPPSLHISGQQYLWKIGLQTEFQPAPSWLIDLAKHSGGAGIDRSHIDTERLFTDGIGEGERDATLFRVSAKLRAAGIPEDVAQGVIGELARRCSPMFDPDDAMKKVASAYSRYAAGTWTPYTEDPRVAEWSSHAAGLDDIPEVM